MGEGLTSGSASPGQQGQTPGGSGGSGGSLRAGDGPSGVAPSRELPKLALGAASRLPALTVTQPPPAGKGASGTISEGSVDKVPAPTAGVSVPAPASKGVNETAPGGSDVAGVSARPLAAGSLPLAGEGADETKQWGSGGGGNAEEVAEAEFAALMDLLLVEGEPTTAVGRTVAAAVAAVPRDSGGPSGAAGQNEPSGAAAGEQRTEAAGEEGDDLEKKGARKRTRVKKKKNRLPGADDEAVPSAVAVRNSEPQPPEARAAAGGGPAPGASLEASGLRHTATGSTAAAVPAAAAGSGSGLAGVASESIAGTSGSVAAAGPSGVGSPVAAAAAAGGLPGAAAVMPGAAPIPSHLLGEGSEWLAEQFVCPITQVSHFCFFIQECRMQGSCVLPLILSVNSSVIYVFVCLCSFLADFKQWYLRVLEMEAVLGNFNSYSSM